MGSALFVWTVVALWAATGVTASIVMGRRGHHWYTWLLLGVVFGPLVVPIAINAARTARHDPLSRAHRLSEGAMGPGAVDVLVGIDGSVESAAALRAALRLFADRIGRLTLAAVVDYDTATSGRPWGTERDATEELVRSAGSVTDREPGTVLLAGHPATALLKYATEEGYEVLFVGRRGHGASKALLGSTAMRLAQDGGVPVVVV
jgi:nucleotide-binding universal stress UspA family protein